MNNLYADVIFYFKKVTQSNAAVVPKQNALFPSL